MSFDSVLSGLLLVRPIFASAFSRLVCLRVRETCFGWCGL